MQVDVKFIAPIKGLCRRHYQFTAIDDCTRIRVLRVYDRLSQKTAIKFVDYLVQKLQVRGRGDPDGQRRRVPIFFATPGGVDRRGCASVDSRQSTGGSRGGFELLLLPCLNLGVVVERREDPAEQAQTRPLAPTAAARNQTCRLLRSADQGEDDIADR